MLTASEVTDRRRARRLLELKRSALEEAVERTVCERVYDRIWKPRSTDDDARDEKLRSKTAALNLVGIGLKELHVEWKPNEMTEKDTQDKENAICESLTPARDALSKMDDQRCPLAKLHLLIAAHQSIVETLSQQFPSTSSADEILPTLIYTLITSPPDDINVVSNLGFIQRFRASAKVDGEAAYCLVNLEAAISFLETVDLSSLREDERPDGPPKSSSLPSTPAADSLAAKSSPSSVSRPQVTTTTVKSRTDAVKGLPRPSVSTDRPQLHQRRISQLVQAQADRIEAGRENFLHTADRIYDSINGTLENSFQFVFGRFKDQTLDRSALPRTLEDARRLVSPVESSEDGFNASGYSTPNRDDPLNSTKDGSGSNGRVLEIIGGRRPLRDRSVDSTRSVGSGKRVAWASSDPTLKDRPPDQATSAGNLLATINPLNRFGVNVPGFARLGRTPQAPPHQPSIPPTTLTHGSSEKIAKLKDIVESPRSSPTLGPRARDRDGNDDQDHLNAREALEALRKTKPPRKRYLDVASAGELRLAEVEDLLVEYRRLAKAIGDAVAT